jgi:hypothetical protein
VALIRSFKEPFGGIGVTLLWEAVLKPRRERRSIAKALWAEMWMNQPSIIEHQALADREPKSIPGDFSLSTIVYSALAARLSELPRDLLPLVVQTYRTFDYLNAVVRRFSVRVEKYYAEDRGAGMRAHHENHLKTMAANYRQALDQAEVLTRAAAPRLFAAAKPWYKFWWKPDPLQIRSPEQVVAERQATLKQLEERIATADGGYTSPR